MPYTGETYNIPCDRGGFNHNPNIDTIAPVMMIEPSRNINIHNGYRQPRGGTSKINSTAVTLAPQIMGMIDFILVNGTQFQVFATSDGKIYKNPTTTIKTGLSLNKKTNFCVFNNTLYITNGADTIQTWDGAAATTSNLANPATDWGAGDQPIQLLVHGRGLSERLWAIGSPDQPQRVYASANGSDNFVTGVISIDIETGDGYGVVGGVEYQDNLILFGQRKPFIIDDTSATPADWGYINAAWNNGVASYSLICRTENDVLCFTIDGDVYSISAVQETGDYKASSIARPAFIDRWIREQIDLTQIAKFHAIYDPVIRCAKFFMVAAGKSGVNICLPFFIDRPINEAWGPPHENSGKNSGYSASCSSLVRKAVGNNKVYTGDYSGFLWELETANINDDSNAYRKNFVFPYINLGNPIITKHIWKGRLVVEPEGNFYINTDVWVDDDQLATTQISLAGTGAVLDSFVLDTDILGGQYLIDTDFAIGTTGKRIKGEFYNTNVNEDFKVSQILLQFRPLGVRP